MSSGVKTVGRYELLNELGRGAMGVVYKARDPKIDRLVAIKTISIFAHTPEEDREFRERLVTEAKAAGRLSHPGIVTVFDVGEDPDTLNPYIVMEYVAGESLEKQVAESADRLPLGSTLALVEQVAEALDYAHSQGIVHRDIKPANILLPENGPPKITDFGIAKLNFGHPTSLNEGMGTPAFMSPEQLNGEAVDGRSDLFSLGVVLYTLLTGYRPFQGNSALTVQFKVMNRNPLPATAFDSAFPPELDYVVSRAMAKDPADRYPTGREMAADIRALREAFGQAPSSEEGSFDAIYVQTASKFVNPTLPQKSLSTIIKKPSTRASKSPSLWHNWRYLSAGALTIAILALSLMIVERRYSVSIATESAAPAEPSSGAVQQSSPSTASTIVTTEVAGPSSPLHRAKTKSRRGVSSRNMVTARSATVSTIPSGATTQQIALSTRSEALLRLRIEDKFEQAEVFLWVDDKLAYKQSIGGTVKKKMVVFKGVEGHQSDSLRLPPGEHRLRVRVHATDDSYDQTGTLTAALPAEGERQLLIQCEKHKPVRLTLQ